MTGPMAWCDRCENWAECPCGCGYGWCRAFGDMYAPDPEADCDDFAGEWPDGPDPYSVDRLIEEGY